MSISFAHVENQSENTDRWEEKRILSKRDLALKRIALGVLVTFNLALVAGAAAGLVLYACEVPIPNEVLFSSPIVAGVLSTMAWLKLPTFTLSKSSYREWTNPLSATIKIVSLIFLGFPLVVYKHSDWNRYHDLVQADKITNAMQGSFKKFAKTCGDNLSALKKYGFLPRGNQEINAKLRELHTLIEEFRAEYKEYKEIKYSYGRRGLTKIRPNQRNGFPHKIYQESIVLNNSLDRFAEFEERWAPIKESFLPHIPIFVKANCKQKHPQAMPAKLFGKVKAGLSFLFFKPTRRS